MKRIVLTVITGPEMGRRLEVAPEGATLGRSSRMADLKLSDGMLSRLHCRFFLEGDRAMVQDLGSSNGTSLNGTPLGAEPSAMAPGDVVTVGETGLRVTLEDAAPGPARSRPCRRRRKRRPRRRSPRRRAPSTWVSPTRSPPQTARARDSWRDWPWAWRRSSAWLWAYASSWRRMRPQRSRCAPCRPRPSSPLNSATSG